MCKVTDAKEKSNKSIGPDHTLPAPLSHHQKNLCGKQTDRRVDSSQRAPSLKQTNRSE